MALSRHRGCYVGISVTLFAATAALALRLYARQLTRVRLGLDDYLCIVAYVSFLCDSEREVEQEGCPRLTCRLLGIRSYLLRLDVQLCVGL